MPVTILYADCPWRYDSVKTGGSMKSGAAQHYPTLSAHDLISLPVRQTFRGPGVLFLWATVPLGTDPYDVMSAWGYTYKTAVFWHKTGRKGLGYWFRGAVEVLLVGIKGAVPPFRSIRDNLIAAPVERHSQKPQVFRDLIDEVTSLYPLRRRVELFARGPRVPDDAHWQRYGLDTGHDLTRPETWTAMLPAAPAAGFGGAAEVGAMPTFGITTLDAPAVGFVDDRPDLEHG